MDIIKPEGANTVYRQLNTTSLFSKEWNAFVSKFNRTVAIHKADERIKTFSLGCDHYMYVPELITEYFRDLEKHFEKNFGKVLLVRTSPEFHDLFDIEDCHRRVALWARLGVIDE